MQRLNVVKCKMSKVFNLKIFEKKIITFVGQRRKMKRKITVSSQIILDSIIHGAKEIKAENIVNVNLSKINHPFCSNFIICDALSNTQVTAIADSIKDTVEDVLKIKPYFVDGYSNAEWIIIDFGEIIVHVFQRDIREHYDIEGLWADAEITRIQD